mmetsp:Transcript_59074/g.183092  ORF Transcript_59074/g.183092 Transcript_59074/m.183092 type:complete len:220 (+) Transcript_59074:867-1526(+)
MTVTSVSKRATVPSSSKPWWSAVAKVVATGIGSDMPVLSMSTWSKRRSNAIARTLSMRSSRRVQQMQPLWSSTTLSLLSENCTPSCSSFASTFMSAMSLTRTATRMPSRLLSTCVSKVVLPAPRKPLSTVTGNFSESSPLHSSWWSHVPWSQAGRSAMWSHVLWSQAGRSAIASWWSLVLWSQARCSAIASLAAMGAQWPRHAQQCLSVPAAKAEVLDP